MHPPGAGGRWTDVPRATDARTPSPLTQRHRFFGLNGRAVACAATLPLFLPADAQHPRAERGAPKRYRGGAGGLAVASARAGRGRRGRVQGRAGLLVLGEVSRLLRPLHGERDRRSSAIASTPVQRTRPRCKLVCVGSGSFWGDVPYNAHLNLGYLPPPPMLSHPRALSRKRRPLQGLGSAEAPGAEAGGGASPAREEIPFNVLGSTAQALRLHGGEVPYRTVAQLAPVAAPSPAVVARPLRERICSCHKLC